MIKSSNDKRSLHFKSFLTYWLPPCLWMALIYYFSTDNFSGENTESYLEMILDFLGLDLSWRQMDSVHFMVRKAAHFVVYAILAALLFRAFRFGSKVRWNFGWFFKTLAIVVVYAFLDEWHQSFTRYRYGTIIDSLIDIAGSLAALGLIWVRGRVKD